MKLKEFVGIIKKSHIAGNNKRKIIYQLLQAAGAEGVSYRTSCQSPSESTIQNWLSEKEGKPGVSRYFPALKIKDEKGARDFLWKTPRKNQWIELRDLFKEWHNNSQNVDKDFYIDTETDDFDTFNISFWKQFITYFDSLHLWEGAEEPQPKTGDGRENSKSDLIDKMTAVFKENFMLYRVYEFIPKEIINVINSLNIYYAILNAQTQLTVQDGIVSEDDIIRDAKKMYCKLILDYKCFVFDIVACLDTFWELELPKECMIIKYNGDFTYDMFPTNTWVSAGFKYDVIKSSAFQDGRFEEEAFSWKECQGKIIVVDIDLPIDDEETHPIIEDWYVLIDEMLTQEYLIDEFITVISEKIVKKYEGLVFDNNTRLLYNDINQYIETLSGFKEYLTKFRNLEKEKNSYLSDQTLKRTFDIYSSFSNFEVVSKPEFPFSECYLDPDEADKVQAKLCHCHKRLIDLYAEIVNKRGMVEHK